MSATSVPENPTEESWEKSPLPTTRSAPNPVLGKPSTEPSENARIVPNSLSVSASSGYAAYANQKAGSRGYTYPSWWVLRPGAREPIPVGDLVHGHWPRRTSGRLERPVATLRRDTLQLATLEPI